MQALLVVDAVDEGDRRSCGRDRDGARMVTGVAGGLCAAASGRLWLAAAVAAAAALAAQPVGAVHASAPAPAVPAWLDFHPAPYPFDLAARSGGAVDTASTDRTPAPGAAARPQPIPAARAAALTSPPEPAAVAPAVSTAPVPPRTLLFPGERLVLARTWFVAGAIILLARMVSVGGAVTVLGLFGASSFVVGAVALVVDLTWGIQAAIFALAAVTFAIARPLFDRHGGPPPGLGGRGPEALIGRVFKLERPITGGEGMLTSGGTAWRITAARDWPAGRRVRVVRTEGTLLVVQPVEC